MNLYLLHILNEESSALQDVEIIIGIRIAMARTSKETNFCCNCNIRRNIGHFYCFLCGAKLTLKPAPQKKIKEPSKYNCEFCDTTFIQKRKTDVVCGSEKCSDLESRFKYMRSYYRMRGRMITRKDLITPRICIYCHKEIPLDTNLNRKYCNFECYTKYYVGRNKGEKITLSSNLP